MFELLHAKTDAGRAEIRSRALPLSRAARNLLLVLDASKPAGEWLKLVTGATPSDLDALRQHGLVAPQAGAASTTSPVPAPAPMPVAAVPAQAAAAPAGALLHDRAALYTYLSGDGLKHLGTVKGYGFALKVERADGLQDLQALAQQLVDLVAKAKGDAAADGVRQTLGLR